MQDSDERIEVLSVEYLDSQRTLVEEFRALAEQLNQDLGWHYLLDLPWVACHLRAGPGAVILDAGAGLGLLQWWLAQLGAGVISVDRMTRANLPPKLRTLYHISGLRPEDVSQHSAARTIISFLPSRYPRRWNMYPGKLRAALDVLFGPTHQRAPGKVFVYNQDLRYMPDVASDSMDAIASISALEHNRPEELRDCVSELMRILKPGGQLVATLAAARDEDWFHEPSRGWCYTEATLRKIFDLPADCPSNFDRYDELFEWIRSCDELRENLAEFYFKSGDNGMPWGIWDPQYQPVGVVKVKSLV